MFGHSAFSEFAFSEFGFTPYVPPPPPNVSGADGYEIEQYKKYLEAQKKLANAQRARDRAKKAAKDNIRQSIGEVVDPENYRKPEPQVKEKKARPVLTAKPIEVLEDNVAEMQANLHQAAYALWQANEYHRLIQLEAHRKRIRQEEEAFLLLL